MGHTQGPVDTPFEHGCFQLAIVVPDSYPLVPPSVRFVTRVFHPNVHFKVEALRAAPTPMYAGQLYGVSTYVRESRPSQPMLQRRVHNSNFSLSGRGCVVHRRGRSA